MITRLLSLLTLYSITALVALFALQFIDKTNLLTYVLWGLIYPIELFANEGVRCDAFSDGYIACRYWVYFSIIGALIGIRILLSVFKPSSR